MLKPVFNKINKEACLATNQRWSYVSLDLGIFYIYRDFALNTGSFTYFLLSRYNKEVLVEQEDLISNSVTVL